MWDAIQNYQASQSGDSGGGFWNGLKNFGTGMQERMSGQQTPMSDQSWKIYPGSGLQDNSMQSSMMNGGDPNLMNAFQRMKQMFTPQMEAPTNMKYQRNVAPPNMGAGAPTPMGDLRMTMASPYSPSSPSRNMIW